MLWSQTMFYEIHGDKWDKLKPSLGVLVNRLWMGKANSPSSPLSLVPHSRTRSCVTSLPVVEVLAPKRSYHIGFTSSQLWRWRASVVGIMRGSLIKSPHSLCHSILPPKCSHLGTCVTQRTKGRLTGISWIITLFSSLFRTTSPMDGWWMERSTHFILAETRFPSCIKIATN